MNEYGQVPSGAEVRQPLTGTAWVYMVRCERGELYSGWTNDLAKRLRAHRTGKGGAKYTRAHGAIALAYAERCADKSTALRREIELKALTKADKEALCAAWACNNAVTLRAATPDDAEAVVTLYNRYVRGSTATFQYEPSTVEDYRAQIAEVWQHAPFLLAETADGRLAGYACAHPWHERKAFSWDVELTIYCDPDCVGQGVGRRLYTALIELVRRQGYHNAYALVAWPNPASEAFHRAFGFRRYGLERNTGYKFGQWLGLGYWALPLQDADGAPAPVRLRLTEQEIAEACAVK